MRKKLFLMILLLIWLAGSILPCTTAAATAGSLDTRSNVPESAPEVAVAQIGMDLTKSLQVVSSQAEPTPSPRPTRTPTPPPEPPDARLVDTILILMFVAVLVVLFAVWLVGRWNWKK